MAKTSNLVFKVDKKTKEKFVSKAKLLGLTMTQFIEKISNEAVIFVELNGEKTYI